MERFTTSEYVQAFIANQTNKDDFRADYPCGMSVNDICENDTIDVYFDDDSMLLIDCGTAIAITDIENIEARYEI